jgi:SAM-dependent methyltransferase
VNRGTRDSGLSHAAQDLRVRNAKARKIERLLGLDVTGPPLRLLEVGTGSGAIAHHFATREGRTFAVDAVDVVDQRTCLDGYRFTRLAGVELPFADASFDVVISNHVIEHVGDAAAQALHLAEIARVLAPGGVAYLAVPNRWMVVEPHYRLAFLSWLPPAWRSPYLRLRGRGSAYDCRPLAGREAERALRAAGLRFTQHDVDALRVLLEIERPGSAWTRLPLGPLRWLRRWFPTLIYTLRHDEAARTR